MQNVHNIINEVDNISLAHSFQDACSDNDFKKYVYKLNTTEEILMKYTSRLLDAYEECKNCTTCDNLKECKNKVTGYAYTPIANDKTIEFSYVRCKKKEDDDNQTA